MGDKRLIYVFLFIIALLALGTMGYVIIEDYPVSDALYMTIITISTVGFGETHPLSQAGRLFTSGLILIGFAGVAFVGRILVEGIFEGVWSGQLEARKMKSRLEALKDHYIVCGYGRVGKSAVQCLVDAKVEFVIVDNGTTPHPDITENDYVYFEGDATDEAILLEVGIKRAKGLMSLLNSDPDNLFLALTARELNPTLYIVSRANDTSAERKILRAGADKVITPMVSAGQQIVEAVLGGTSVSMNNTLLAQEAVTPRWIDVDETSSIVGITIASLSEMMSQPILGLRRAGIDFILPDAAVTIQPEDKIFVIYDEKENDGELNEHQGQKVVIVEDNPVILKLYARLFRRRGFVPILAENGREGLDAIIREKPMVAVVDFMLPVMSGIDLCEKVRTNPALDATKLILFTADDQTETRRRAFEAGVNEVIVKSANASKIIDTVIDLIGVASETEQPVVSIDDFLTPPPIMPDEASPLVANDSINFDAALEMVGSDEEMLIELFESCQMEMPDILQEIADAIQSKDAKQLQSSAHKIKGTFIYVAADEAADLARQLESLGKNEDLSSVASVSNLFFKECERVDEFITRYLAACNDTPA